MIPEEDRPASWLRGDGSVEADIRQMREFADKLRAEVESNYTPHLSYIANDMLTQVSNPADAFIELVQFMRTHWETQQAATNAVWGLGHTTGHLAAAAKEVADRYGDADAFAAARVTDVQQALGRIGAPIAQPEPSPSLTDPSGPDNRGPVVLP
ncbi:hypothetical protein C1I95_08505 [Micromonospora craterilacus]|uniref:Uncharacterized protein n=1 Tax=Micromonospora craterilacus TaxID=1655439 RepID=A0A2W2E9M0_9ACTN|nr:hypothetical protein [Micromonospora craterilacus]PZG20986.1 hypothetical protein C1I95_08505 [Micromonospora craterilacus]